MWRLIFAVFSFSNSVTCNLVLITVPRADVLMSSLLMVFHCSLVQFISIASKYSIDTLSNLTPCLSGMFIRSIELATMYIGNLMSTTSIPSLVSFHFMTFPLYFSSHFWDICATSISFPSVVLSAVIPRSLNAISTTFRVDLGSISWFVSTLWFLIMYKRSKAPWTLWRVASNSSGSRSKWT